MKKIKLPAIAQAVSPLCLGTMNYGGKLAEEDALRQLDLFVECSGNLLDTAHVYNDWLPGERHRSEKILGKWMRERHCREQVVLATKGAHPDLDTPTQPRVTPSCIEQDMKESLECLQTDHVDLYYLHRDDPSVPVDEILDCLNRHVASGEIGALGCSNWTLRRMREANEVAKKRGWHGFSINQPMWSLARIRREALPADYAMMDDELYAYHAEQGMPAMCFTAQAKGYFVRRDAGNALPQSVTNVYESKANDALYEEMKKWKPKFPKAMSDFPLQFFRVQPFPAIPIVSCSTITQLEDCLHAFEIEPPEGLAWPKA